MHTIEMVEEEVENVGLCELRGGGVRYIYVMGWGGKQLL